MFLNFTMIRIRMFEYIIPTSLKASKVMDITDKLEVTRVIMRIPNF